MESPLLAKSRCGQLKSLKIMKKNLLSGLNMATLMEKSKRILALLLLVRILVRQMKLLLISKLVPKQDLTLIKKETKDMLKK